MEQLLPASGSMVSNIGTGGVVFVFVDLAMRLSLLKMLDHTFRMYLGLFIVWSIHLHTLRLTPYGCFPALSCSPNKKVTPEFNSVLIASVIDRNTSSARWFG